MHSPLAFFFAWRREFSLPPISIGDFDDAYRMLGPTLGYDGMGSLVFSNFIY
jgi:hypothetical protein